jgi:nicotinamidase-related amidase
MNQTTRRRDVLRGSFALSLLGLGAGSLTATPAAAQDAALGTAVAPVGGSILDPRDVQILFADLQVPLVATSRTVTAEPLGRSACVLAKVASILKMPMLFSVVGEPTPPLIPELLPFATDGNTIFRKPASPFSHPPTVEALAASGRRTLVIAGFAAEVVVLHAALDAIAAGYTVFTVVDAIGSQSERTEAAALREMERAGAVPTSVLSLTTRLAPDFDIPPGSQTFAALRPLLGG